MKRLDIPLWVGIAGLLLLQVACADSPTGPQGAGAPEQQQARQYLHVQVRNEVDGPVYVSLDLEGIGVEPLGIVRAGSASAFDVSLDRAGTVRLVAISVAHGERLESDPLEVRAGWAVDISITSAGTVARAYPAPREY